METTRIGIIGCGNISPAYLATLKNQTAVQVVALADLDMAKAQARAAEYGLRAVSVDELLALIDAAGGEALAICLDTGHLNLLPPGDQGRFIRRAVCFAK